MQIDIKTVPSRSFETFIYYVHIYSFLRLEFKFNIYLFLLHAFKYKAKCRVLHHPIFFFALKIY